MGRPDWSLSKFRETKMEMPSTLISNVPCKVLDERNEKQGSDESNKALIRGIVFLHRNNYVILKKKKKTKQPLT